MTEPAERRPKALVVGGGVVGLCCARALVRRFDVILIDEAAGSNASTVAAGMLAPAMEAALDPAAPPYALLNEAREVWTSFAARIGAPSSLHTCGSLFVGLPAEVAAVLDRLAAEGAEGGRVEASDLRRLQPELAGGFDHAAFAGADARLDVTAVLERLTVGLIQSGVVRRSAEVVEVDATGVRLADGVRLSADVVVVAAGFGAARFAASAPELAALTPIKGQRVRFAVGPAGGGAVVRTSAAYLAPSAAGAVAGATMEVGRDDGEVDPAVVAGFARAATALFPSLVDVVWTGAAGVRAATPDGLPLVGPSETGLLLAAGFRRNGWLLAPLAAEMIAAYAVGEDPGVWAGALTPGRPLTPGRTG